MYWHSSNLFTSSSTTETPLFTYYKTAPLYFIPWSPYTQILTLSFIFSLGNKGSCKKSYSCPVSWGCRIHWRHLCRGVNPPITSVLDMTLNNLMVRFQQCWSLGECGVPLHCHRSQVHSGPEWWHLMGPYLWVK